MCTRKNGADQDTHLLFIQMSIMCATFISIVNDPVTGRTDFLSDEQTVTFGPGPSFEIQQIFFEIFDDAVYEASEGFLAVMEVDTELLVPQDLPELKDSGMNATLLVIFDDDCEFCIATPLIIDTSPIRKLHQSLA